MNAVVLLGQGLFLSFLVLQAVCLVLLVLYPVYVVGRFALHLTHQVLLAGGWANFQAIRGK